ncbi:MAG: type II toxin-antitoxin system PemK/MazF family toxin [Acidobacteria bacterium]|nr:type II toxin-antitoxin system PemK/MazF family toxin [Acidobacteriota bacterium]
MVVRRGEVWRVNLDPTIGAEIQKIRPVVVVSSDAIGILPIKLVAPVTDWKDRYAHSSWHVKIDPDTANGLTKTSAVDTLQLRGVDTSRFLKRLGRVSADKIEEVAAAIAAVVEYA